MVQSSQRLPYYNKGKSSFISLISLFCFKELFIDSIDRMRATLHLE